LEVPGYLFFLSAYLNNHLKGLHMPVFRDSDRDEAWIQQAITTNPITFTPDGNMVTCPVRGGYVALTKKSVAKRRDDGSMSNEKHEMEILFPMTMDQLVAAGVYQFWYDRARREFPGNFKPDGTFFGLEFPFNDQARKQDKPGYTPGWVYIRATTERDLRLVDANMNPIMDHNEIHSGAWFIVALNLWGYNNKKRGVSFGLQTVMKIASDRRTYNGGADPRQAFAGVKVDASYSPVAAMMAPGQPGQGPARTPMPQSYGQPAAPPAPPQQQQQPAYAQPGYAPPQESHPGVAATPPQGYGQPPQPPTPPQQFQHAAPPPPPPPPAAPSYPPPPPGYVQQ
jgi:hypothetical protein